MEPISLDAKRKAKETKCAMCGNPTHDFIGQCPRICALTEETDGSLTPTKSSTGNGSPSVSFVRMSAATAGWSTK